jgi:hypothetical protein
MADGQGRQKPSAIKKTIGGQAFLATAAHENGQ